MRANLLLLHGAIGASAQFEPLLPFLSDDYRVHRLDFEGHGSAPPKERPFRIEHFAENVAGYLAHQGLERADVFGYSMGGYVALYLARTQPQFVGRVATLGTKFHWDAETAAREVRQLDPETIRAKVPGFARALAERHAAGWEMVLNRTAEMLAELGRQNLLTLEALRDVQQRVRVMLGDRDATVTFDESAAAYRAMPNAEFEVLPNTPHPLERVDLNRLARSLKDFFV